jgi:Uma2 family endonuclease
MVEVVFESVRTMSQAEFSAWVKRRESGDPNRYELLNGRVVMNPPAGYPHGSVEARVQHALMSFVAPRGLGQVLGSSQGFVLPSGDTVEPDASFVSPARWDAMPAPAMGEFLQVVPDLVVEILAGGTASRDRGEKKAIYAQNGVTEYWLVDPRAREVTVFTLTGARYDAGRVAGADERVRSGVLVGFECEVAALLP